MKPSPRGKKTGLEHSPWGKTKRPPTGSKPSILVSSALADRRAEFPVTWADSFLGEAVFIYLADVTPGAYTPARTVQSDRTNGRRRQLLGKQLVRLLVNGMRVHTKLHILPLSCLSAVVFFRDDILVWSMFSTFELYSE